MTMSHVLIYTRKQCAFCQRAKQLFDKMGVVYEEINLDEHPDQLEEMLQRSEGRRSVPQIHINGKPVGGFEDVLVLQQQGKLTELLGIET